MNLENCRKKLKFICFCCPNEDEFNIDEVIFDYFGKEFTEYEYVVENMAIRPAPKKLLDLVPVHSTSISSRESSQTSKREPPAEPLTSNGIIIMPSRRQPGGEGDEQKTQEPRLPIKNNNSGFISFKEPTKEILQTKPDKYKILKNVTELRQTTRTKEYKTKKEILSDLCETSEQCLNFEKPKIDKSKMKEMPLEIKDTIDNLKFKKPLRQFSTRTEKQVCQDQEVHFAGISTPKTLQMDLKEYANPAEEPNRNNNENFSQESQYSAVDSTVQTDASKPSEGVKKSKKTLKWKIIINKHSDCKH
ncbi:hypothetical protein ABEB36_013134 [Hypothenemus hampei]|uniref:Uncharacterized protein n=1 Tax=Hypothenemus hampei TaxID=57062 RepID=A0ABD1E908_HYPHA